MDPEEQRRRRAYEAELRRSESSRKAKKEE
jgi:hypothetical protein